MQLTETPEFVAQLNDTDLRALLYIVDQVETYASFALPPHAARLSRAAQQEQTRRDKARRVALSSPAFIPFMVTLLAGPK